MKLTEMIALIAKLRKALEEKDVPIINQVALTGLISIQIAKSVNIQSNNSELVDKLWGEVNANAPKLLENTHHRLVSEIVALGETVSELDTQMDDSQRTYNGKLVEMSDTLEIKLNERIKEMIERNEFVDTSLDRDNIDDVLSAISNTLNFSNNMLMEKFDSRVSDIDVKIKSLTTTLNTITSFDHFKHTISNPVIKGLGDLTQEEDTTPLITISEAFTNFELDDHLAHMITLRSKSEYTHTLLMQSASLVLDKVVTIKSPELMTQVTNFAIDIDTLYKNLDLATTHVLSVLSNNVRNLKMVLTTLEV